MLYNYCPDLPKKIQKVKGEIAVTFLNLYLIYGYIYINRKKERAL